MKKLIRYIIVAAAGVVMGAAVSISGQELFPDGPGRDTLFLVCVQCHPPDRITDASFTAEDWEFIVYDMIARGAPVYKKDIKDLRNYLVDNFATDK